MFNLEDGECATKDEQCAAEAGVSLSTQYETAESRLLTHCLLVPRATEPMCTCMGVTFKSGGRLPTPQARRSVQRCSPNYGRAHPQPRHTTAPLPLQNSAAARSGPWAPLILYS